VYRGVNPKVEKAGGALERLFTRCARVYTCAGCRGCIREEDFVVVLLLEAKRTQ